ncbi:XH domain-containing protein, partial [Cephalotus follicularis]
LRKELEEKKDAIQDLESFNGPLILRELRSNQELQDARKELLSGLQDMLNGRTTIGIKRMGEIDRKSFQNMCQLRFSSEYWEDISAKLCSLWEDKVRDSNWHPFKQITSMTVCKYEIVDDNDENLKELSSIYGEDVYKAVTRALVEVNEYNPSGRYPVPEIWNFKEDRRASLKEVIHYIIKQLKTRKPKR